MQFHGEYQHRIDAQGRIALPSRFREAFRRGMYVTKGLDLCIWVFSPESWEEWSGSIAAMSAKSRTGRVLRRQTFGSTYDLEMDRQGRVLLPVPLRKYGNLNDEITIVGGGNYLELWNRTRWEQEELPFVEEAAARMADAAQESM